MVDINKTKSKRSPRRRASASTVADFVSAMESIAPVGLAQSWDNVGLLAGDPAAALRRVLLCIDLTRNVVDEAIKTRVDVVMAYHPPIFNPIASLRADSTATDAAVFRCIANGIAVYSTHTALDAATGGTNDTIASLCGIDQTEPLEYVDDPHSAPAPDRTDGTGTAHEHETGAPGSANHYKLVTFVPAAEADDVANALFRAGAGHIGHYARCSYRVEGVGTFFGGRASNPTIGEKGRMEFVNEIRLETVVPASCLPAVISALRNTHSYDEPAFDIYPLAPRPVRGIGRIGALPKAIALETLAKKLRRVTGANSVHIVGARGTMLDRASIVVGAAGQLPFKLKLTERDVIITGEIRHHDALTIRRFGCSAIALGHWASERPVLQPLAARLAGCCPSVRVLVSEADVDPFSVP